MNILKEIFNLPNTNAGRKRRYNLLNRLGIEKRDKAVVSKEIESGELGGVLVQLLNLNLEKFVG